MADLPTKKISELPIADALGDNDVLVGVQDGVTKRFATAGLLSGRVFQVLSYAEMRSLKAPVRAVILNDPVKGGVFYPDSGDSSSLDDGGVTIVTDQGLRLKRPIGVRVQVQWFEGSSDTSIVQAAINCALSLGFSEVEVARTYDCATPLENRTNVRFVGVGSLTGAGAYRVTVAPEHAPSGREAFQDLLPAKHLRSFSASPAPVVVICGSSTGAWLADTVDTGNGVTPMLQRLLGKYNPDRPIVFYNRCIGAQTFTTLNSIPVTSNFPAWYTDTSKPWLDYVNDLRPDLVVVISGSNDSSALTRVTVKETIDKVGAFVKPNDLVFITQPSVCPDPNPAFSTFSTKAAQEGRDFAAGLVRSMARYYTKGLIDANRMGGIVLDGRDLLDNATMRVIPTPPLANGKFSPALEAHDFSLLLTFTGNSAANDSAFLGAANPVFVKVGAVGGNTDSGDVIFVKKNSGGFLVLELYSSGIYRTLTTGISFPPAGFILDVIKVNNVVTFSFNGSEDTLRVSVNVIAAGGLMFPRSGYFNLSTGPWASAILNVGEPKKYKKLLTSTEAWGAANPSAARQMPYGGNGVNHFSSLGTREIYGRALDTDAWTACASDSGEYTPTLVPNVATPPSTLNLPANTTWAWKREGFVVTVEGVVNIADVDGNCGFSATLPIVPSSLSPSNTIGIVSAKGVTGSGFGDPVNRLVAFDLTGVPSTAAFMRLTFSYRLN